MNRTTYAAGMLLISGFAVLGLSACGAGTDGTGSTDRLTAGTTTTTGSMDGLGTPVGQAPAPASTSVDEGPTAGTSDTTGTHGSQNTHGTGTTQNGTTQNGTTHNGTTHNGTTHTGSTTPRPQIVSASITCEVTGHVDYPGLPNTPIYSPVVTWTVRHASGLALSVDNDDLVGAYGTYDGTSGSVTLGAGCYVGEKHHVVFTTVGGTGPAATRAKYTPADRNRVTPPPFGYGNGSAGANAPSPSPSS